MAKVLSRLIVAVCVLAGAAPAFGAADIQVFREGLVAENTTDNIGASTIGTPRSVIYMVFNAGDMTAQLPNGVGIASSTNAACVISSQPGVVIPANQTSLFTLSVTPGGAAFSCVLEVFSNDPDSPYTFTVGGTATGGSTADILISGPNGEIVDGEEDAFAVVPGTTGVRTYTITNSGAQTLVCGTVTIDQEVNATCTTTQPLQQQIGTGESVTFEVALTPSDALYSCTVSVPSNDPDESPYTVTIGPPNAGVDGLEVVVSELPSTTTTVVTPTIDVQHGDRILILPRFTIAPVRQASSLSFLVRNKASEPIVFGSPPITTARELNTECRISGSAELSSLMPGDESTLMSVEISPLEPGPFECEIVITTTSGTFTFTYVGQADSPRSSTCSTGGEPGWLAGLALSMLVLLRHGRRHRKARRLA